MLAAVRSSRFDRPFTYAAGEIDLHVGDVVAVPLGSREIVGFVVSPVREIEDDAKLKPISRRLDVAPAFDAIGLSLARFIAERYLCTLGEALGAVVRGDALPIVRDVLRRVEPSPSRKRSALELQLLQIVRDELPPEFELQRLLRHPAARRAGDRPALLQAVRRLREGGDLLRERSMAPARTREYRVRVLFAGDVPASGPRARALVEFVAQRPDGIPRADALLAGFSQAVIARAIAGGALREQRLRPPQPSDDAPGHRSRHAPPATAEQAAVLARLGELLEQRRFAEVLLFGVTGSGKTYVYLAAIERLLAGGGRAIVLVPEISLTPQTAARFEAAFGRRVAVLHSALSERERFDAWEACRAGAVDVVVGARSAVFAPLRNVRAIVVDEAHEASYKQETVPRYRATAVARERMRLEGGLLILGSATPSLESYAAAQAGRIELLRMERRATDAPMPRVEVVDLAREFQTGDRGVFSTALIAALTARLDAGEKSLLFVNRRGSARFALCRACGFVPHCTRCDVALAVHRSEGLLRCHYCDFRAPVPEACPQCGGALREFGFGTEAVVSQIERLFPVARVLRMDSDTTTRIGDHARILREFETGGDVLAGTQMIAKGLDFPSVTLAGVVVADTGLHVPDFRAAERTFALIAQVCGRSGRRTPGEAVVQTYVPEHPAIAFAAAHDYEGFARYELAHRREAGYPPFTRLAYLMTVARTRRAAGDAAARYADALRARAGIEVLGPAPAPIARRNDEWRFRVALKCANGVRLRAAIREAVVPLARADRSTRLAIDVDP